MSRYLRYQSRLRLTACPFELDLLFALAGVPRLVEFRHVDEPFDSRFELYNYGTPDSKVTTYQWSNRRGESQNG